MQSQVSKSNFKAQALKIMRDVEETGDQVIITDHGKPTLVLKKYSASEKSPMELLEGSVIDCVDATAPVDEDIELAKIVEERKDQPEIEVDIDELS
jgi:prevent-host-death family protein